MGGKMKEWLVWSSEDDILEDFDTEQEAIDLANETLALWREEAIGEGEWGDGVEFISVYQLAHCVKVGQTEMGDDYKLFRVNNPKGGDDEI
jgi:hypothetical protein